MVLNILVNATQAIEGAGRVTVHTRVVDHGADPSHVDTPPMVEFTITDTGCGIPEANMQRIFDPFFTSKEVGKGTGLGLSVSYGIVKSHGGDIAVDSTEGIGTTFRIVLPLASPFGDDAGAAPESTP